MDLPSEEELVLCVVDRVLGTTVFVKIEKYNKEGVIPTSEIAPGRIRNIRDYVVPGKRIVCKVMRVDKEKGSTELSLRRVTSKEREKLLEDFEKEKNILAAIKAICKEKTDDILKKIEKENKRVTDFFAEADTKKLLSLGVNAEQAEQLLKALSEKQKRFVFLKARIMLSSQASDGMLQIKKILKSAEKYGGISYIAAPYYLLKIQDKNYKDVNRKFLDASQLLEAEAKKHNCKFEIKEEK